MRIHEIRLRNLRALLEARFGGVIARLARAIEKAPNHVRVVLNPTKPGGRWIGERLAREIEERLALPWRSLDIEDEELYNRHILAEAQGLDAKKLDSAASAGPLPFAGRVYPLLNWVQASAWQSVTRNPATIDTPEWFSCHRDLGTHGYVLRVEDDSMTCQGSPWSFSKGMLLYVNPDAKPAAGQFVIVRRAGIQAVLFRKLTAIEGELYLETLNPFWPHRYTKIAPDDALCGVVINAAIELP